MLLVDNQFTLLKSPPLLQVAALDRVLTRLALTDDDKLQQVRLT